jgi:hypothetical protein
MPSHLYIVGGGCDLHFSSRSLGRREERRRGGEKERRGEEKRGREEEERELERHHTRSSSVERDGDGALVWGWMFMFLKKYCGPCIREDMYKVYFNCIAAVRVGNSDVDEMVEK